MPAIPQDARHTRTRNRENDKKAATAPGTRLMAHRKQRGMKKQPDRSLAERIGALDVPESKKTVYRLILDRDALGAWGFINTEGFTWKERWATVSLPVLLSGWIGYLVYGVWRKGLTLAVLWAAYALLLWRLDGAPGLPSLYLPNVIFAFMAVGDTYRQRVLRETFWL